VLLRLGKRQEREHDLVEHVFPRFGRRRRTKVARQEAQVQAQERALGLARERGGEGVQVGFRGGKEDGEERCGSSVQRVEDDGTGVLDAGDERGADGLLGMERPREAAPKDGSKNSQNSASKSLRFWRIWA
jgi:hypothetical protein